MPLGPHPGLINHRTLRCDWVRIQCYRLRWRGRFLRSRLLQSSANGLLDNPARRGHSEPQCGGSVATPHTRQTSFGKRYAGPMRKAVLDLSLVDGRGGPDGGSGGGGGSVVAAAAVAAASAAAVAASTGGVFDCGMPVLFMIASASSSVRMRIPSSSSVFGDGGRFGPAAASSSSGGGDVGVGGREALVSP